MTDRIPASKRILGGRAGTISPPGGNTVAATYAVSEADGGIRISVSVAGMTLDFREIEIGDDGIAFEWTPGPVVRCQLERA